MPDPLNGCPRERPRPALTTDSVLELTECDGVVSESSLLGGKSVVITGAGRGLGASYARCCAELGASLTLADIDPDPLADVVGELRSAGFPVQGRQTDVTNVDDVAGLIGSAEDAFGSLDGIVNNAALQLEGEVDEADPAQARALFDVNVLGVVYGTQAAVRAMRARGSGSIVNVTSGAHCGMAGLSLYGASKGAVASLIYSVALDLGGTGVRINGISPIGRTRLTAQNDAYLMSHGRATAPADLPDPANNAAAVAFLLSDHSSDVNGQIIRVDVDGISVMSQPHRDDDSLVRGMGWTVDAVIAAWRDRLGDHARPVGNRFYRTLDAEADAEAKRYPADVPGSSPG